MAAVPLERINGSGHLGDQHDVQIIELYEAGFSMGFVSRYFGVHSDAVRLRLTRHGVPIRSRAETQHPDRLPHRELDRTRFMYEKLGMGMPEIAERLGVCKTTVKYRLVRAGVKSRSKHESQVLAYRTGRKKPALYKRNDRRPQARIGDRFDAQIIELYVGEGRTQRYISERLGISHGAVRRRLTANGVQIRKRKGSHIAGRLPHYEFERTVFLYARMGLSLQETADQLGTSVGSVVYRLRVAGVQPRTRAEGMRLIWRAGRGKLSGEALTRYQAKLARERRNGDHSDIRGVKAAGRPGDEGDRAAVA